MLFKSWRVNLKNRGKSESGLVKQPKRVEKKATERKKKISCSSLGLQEGDVTCIKIYEL